MKSLKVGIVGCGNISGIYFQNMTNMFDNLTPYACADLREDFAKKAAEEWNIPHIMTFEEMLDCDEIDIILNLTTPQGHYEITKKALEAGKHVYVEKPLSLKFEDGCELVKIAEEKGLLLGCAPDTFLGAGIQTCKALIDAGFIGRIIGATAFMVCHGHESWHPNPEFYYQKGGGPMFDMGPYYLTALVHLMGQVKEVTGMTSISFDERLITSEPKKGEKIRVEVPTHVNGLLRFENGAVASILTSFDVWGSDLPRIEIYGEKGSITVPDPNTFGGPVLLSTLDGTGFKEIPLVNNFYENSRGIGLSDMAQCIIEKRTNNKASGKQANHVLEIMEGIHVSNDTKSYYTMKSEI